MAASRVQIPIGYCTNVHAGTDLRSILQNLRQCALPVRQRLGLSSLGVGLWFSESAASEMLAKSALDSFRDELGELGLFPYTINGFPQQDFHQKVVKHRVYEPTWWEPRRLKYTQDLIQLLDSLLPRGVGGSISTLPIAWGGSTPQTCPRDLELSGAAGNLVAIAEDLHRLYETTGRWIRIALEPEPGCVFTDHRSMRAYFERYLTPPAVSERAAEMVRRYLSVCHDVCHAAVMGEDQAKEIRTSRALGIRVGKVQISSAIEVPWSLISRGDRKGVLDQLGQFAEDRYLHQTVLLNEDGERRLIEDLPELLRSIEGGVETLDGCREWRIHFHVPIYIEGWGLIRSTRPEVLALLDLMQHETDLIDTDAQIEVETYAWGVLPAALRASSLDEGIARELDWLRGEMASRAIPPMPRLNG